MSRLQDGKIHLHTLTCDLKLKKFDDSSLMDESSGPGGVRDGPSFHIMNKQDYLLLYGTLDLHKRVRVFIATQKLGWSNLIGGKLP